MTLSALIARVEEGTGPDREIDCLVAAAIDIRVPGVRMSWKKLVDEGGLGWCVEAASRHQSIWRTAIPRYTVSLDAVVLLIKQKLPRGCGWQLIIHDDRGPIQAHVGDEIADAPSPARALLAATLRALSAMEGSKAGLADANSKGPSHDA